MRYSDESPSVFWITFGTFTLRTSSLSDSKSTSADERRMIESCLYTRTKEVHACLSTLMSFGL